MTICDVSIVAANYNNAAYLSEFILSIINSTVHPKQLIIVDDGSTDKSRQILATFEEVSFLYVILFEKNRGFAEALNAGIAAATSKYIMRADPDDIFVRERIELQIEYLDNHHDIDIVGSNVHYFLSEKERLLNTSNFPLKNEEIVQTFRFGEHGLQHPTAVIRRNIMTEYAYIQDNVPAEDYDIFARMAADEKRFANIAKPLLFMRIHKNSASSNIKFKTIKTTFALRDKIFKTKTNKLKIINYYCYIFFYRKYLLGNYVLLNYLYLLISVCFYPQKLFRRFIKY